MMSITKPEHSEANPQCQTGSRPVAEPETPAVHNNSGGWLSWVFVSGRVNKKEVHLPEDKDRLSGIQLCTDGLTKLSPRLRTSVYNLLHEWGHMDIRRTLAVSPKE
ncbi:uncharacterized protein LOC112237968 isoform X4 [Oncorhynchus tshawytscha]|uniref:uncharacterized protein LOC112237968 isoform X4 n=1 Tax=Oncorhynchus tshawytscha TaxID=74940 RepID=UPI001C3E2977|nr:uncharacterized protein LOC112237968 isoform X4 [Oncorhynchus tshawytscha]